MQTFNFGQPAFGNRHQIAREQLYDLVWQTPMSHLAKRFGLSDVGLKKICRKHHIPTPPLGYWAKRAHGKRVDQPSLPATTGPQMLLLTVTPSAAAQPQIQAEQARALEQAAEFPSIQVPSERPTKLHWVASRTYQALRAAKADQHGLKQVGEPGAVAVAVGSASVNRVIRIIDAFALAAERRGFSVTEHREGVQILVEGTPILWQIKETTDRKPHVPTREELRWQARYEAERARYPSLYSSRATQTVHQSWDHFPSGRLTMTLRDPSALRWERKDLIGHWCDRRNKSLEGYLDQAMAALTTGAIAIRHRQAQEAEKERQRLEEIERQRIERERREKAEKRREFLIGKAEEYDRYQKLMALAEFLERDGKSDPNGKGTRLQKELWEIIERMKQDLDLDAMRAEVDLLQLYALEPATSEESGGCQQD